MSDGRQPRADEPRATSPLRRRERFLRALAGGPVDRPPVFPLLMGFSAARLGVSYREFASDGRVLAESQLLAAERFTLDCVTSCSDAFRLSEALGGRLVYPESKPPFLEAPLVRSRADIGRLGRPDPTDRANRMGDRVLGTSLLVEALRGEVAVCGWIDMPFAECCSLCGVTEFLLMLCDEPAAAHVLLERITTLCVDFALAQVETGADMIGADLFNVDHMVPLTEARSVYAAAGRAYKGNVDPVAQVLQASPEECRRRARECIGLAAGTKYMLSAGCEIPAETSDEVFAAFCGGSEALRS